MIVSQHARSIICTSFKMKSQAYPPAYHVMKVYLRRGSISPFIPTASRSRRFTTRVFSMLWMQVDEVQDGRRSPSDLLCSLQPAYKETAIPTVSYLWLAGIRCFAVTWFTNRKILFAILNEVFFFFFVIFPRRLHMSSHIAIKGKSIPLQA